MAEISETTTFQPHPDAPWVCAKCGYPPDALEHDACAGLAPLTPAEIVVFEVLDQVDARASSDVSQGAIARRIVAKLREAGHAR